MDTVAPSPGGLEPRARRQDCARPARIDMPAAQADAGSRNANKAGRRGLLRAGAPGQAAGSQPGEEACGGPSAGQAPLWCPWNLGAGKAPPSRCDLAQHCQFWPGLEAPPRGAEARVPWTRGAQNQSLDQRRQHQLGPGQRCRFSGPDPRPY